MSIEDYDDDDFEYLAEEDDFYCPTCGVFNPRSCNRNDCPIDYLFD